jgi:hypothetical protein
VGAEEAIALKLCREGRSPLRPSASPSPWRLSKGDEMAKDEKRVDLLLELVRAAHDKHLAEMRYQFVLEKLEEEKARSTRPQPTPLRR